MSNTGSNTLEALTSSGAGTAPAELDLDFTAGLPSGVTYTRSGTAWYFNSSGVLTSAAANAARVDYNPSTLAVRGLLIEQGRVQSIQNATGSAGLVVGTPGTVPTRWVQQANATGVTRTVVGSGTVNGMPYVDLQYSGTATASDSVLFFESSSAVATVNATTWTSSLYLALVAGSLTNVTVKQGMRFRAAGGASLGAQIYETTFVPTSTLTRYERAATGSDATIAFVAPSLNLSCASGAVDLTVRISIPQLELGAFATSPLVSTNAGTLTRGSDILTINPLGSWFNPNEGTFYVEASRYAHQSSTNYFAVSDGSTNNSMAFVNGAATPAQQRFDINNGGVATCQFNWTSSSTVDTVYREVAAYRLNDCAGALNGGTVFTDTSTAIPTVNRANIGTNATASTFLCGHMRRIRFWPLRQSNTDVQSLSNASVSISGAGASTLGDLTSAASGLLYIGAGASTLDALVGDGAGTHIEPRTGTGAASLEALVGDGAGYYIEPIAGTAAASLEDLISAASGLTFFGTGSCSLEDLVGSGAGSTVVGTGGVTLADLLAVSVEGWFLVYGSPAETLDAVISGGAGNAAEEFVLGFAGEALDALATAGSAAHGVGSSSAEVLEALVGDGAGVRGAAGDGSATLADLGSSSIGFLRVSGVGAAALPDLASFAFGSAYAARRVRTVRLGGAQRRTISLNATVRQQIGVTG